jgi:hypothetical protein
LVARTATWRCRAQVNEREDEDGASRTETTLASRGPLSLE